MERAMQFIFFDETGRSITVQDLPAFNWQSLAKQAKKMRRTSFYGAYFRKNFDLMGVQEVELSTEKET